MSWYIPRVHQGRLVEIAYAWHEDGLWRRCHVKGTSETEYALAAGRDVLNAESANLDDEPRLRADARWQPILAARVPDDLRVDGALNL